MKWVGEFRDVPVSLVGGRTGKKEDSRISPVLGASGSDTFIYRFLFICALARTRSSKINISGRICRESVSTAIR